MNEYTLWPKQYARQDAPCPGEARPKVDDLLTSGPHAVVLERFQEGLPEDQPQHVARLDHRTIGLG